jgi:hypothetical protein
MPLIPVIGLPGSGKTHTLVCLIIILTLLRKRVLVCGHTHSAVDNILHRVGAYGNLDNKPHPLSFPYIRLGRQSHFSYNDVKACSFERVLRLGRRIQEISSSADLDVKGESRIRKLYQLINPIILNFLLSYSVSSNSALTEPSENRVSFNFSSTPLSYSFSPSILSQCLSSIPIIGTTALSLASSSASSYALLPNSVVFDMCIMDEASQVLLPYAIPALLRSQAAVLMGDPYQLPPLLRSLGIHVDYDEMQGNRREKDSVDNAKIFKVESNVHDDIKLPLSLLAHVLAYRRHLCVWLDTQYRMNIPIMVYLKFQIVFFFFLSRLRMSYFIMGE